jgi:hypothetical protein
MHSPISPWQDETIRIESPDGTMWALIESPSEIAQGAPTFGELKISNGQSAHNCNPSILWSDDSRYLAVPQWFESFQRLLLIDTKLAKKILAPETYEVLELHSFDKGIVEGVDSPIYQPKKISIDIKNLFTA